MFRLALLLLILLPLVELVLLAWIGAHTSWLAVIALVIGTGLVGSWLIRTQGWQTLSRVRADLNAGQAPAEAMFDGALVLLAGLLLILPGVLTDVAAIALLVPHSRELVKRGLRARFAGRTATGFQYVDAQSRPARHAEIIDVRVIESRPQ